MFVGRSGMRGVNSHVPSKRHFSAEQDGYILQAKRFSAIVPFGDVCTS